MALKYQVATEFTILDRASAKLNHMAGAGADFSKTWQRGLSKAELRLDSFGKKVSSVTKLAIGGAITTIGVGLGVAARDYIAFEKSLRSAGAIFGDLNTRSEDYESKLSTIGDKIQKVAATTEFTSEQAASAIFTMAQAGLKSKAALEALPVVADVATAAGLQLDDAFGKVASTVAGIRMNMTGESIKTVSDIMVKASSSAFMSFDEATAAMENAAASFADLGQGPQALGAAIQVLAEQGLRGADAGTKLNRALLQMTNPAKLKKIEEMGVRVKDTAGNMLPLSNIVDSLNKKLSKMGEVQRKATLTDLFATQGSEAMSKLLAAGGDRFREIENEMFNAAGATAQRAADIRKSIQVQLNLLTSALSAKGQEIMKSVQANGVDAIQKLTNAVNSFDITSIINGLTILVNTITTFAKILWHLRGVIAAVVAINVTWNVVTTITILKQRALALGMMFLSGALKTAAFVTGLLSTAVKILNLAFAANPVGFVITAIVLLTGVIITLTGKWQKVSEAVDGFFTRIRNMKGIGGVILNGLLAPFELVWNVVRGLFDTLNAFKSGGFIAGIKMLGLSILQGLASPLEYILKLLSFIPGMSDLNERIHNFFETSRANILAGVTGNTEESAAEEQEVIANTPPTRTAAEARSYTREESVTTNRLEVGLSDGLSVKSGAALAPAFTLQTGRR